MQFFVLSAIFTLFGSLSIWDANRITTSFRRPGAFDVMGPDHYLFGLGILLLCLAAAMFAAALSKKAPNSSSENRSLFNVVAWSAIGLMAVYAMATVTIGYSLATLGFFLIMFPLMGLRSLKGTLIASVLCTLVFHLLFIVFADLPLPVGKLFG